MAKFSLIAFSSFRRRIVPHVSFALTLGLQQVCASDAVAAEQVASKSQLSPHRSGEALQPITLKQFETKPKLILVVVVDQFRADYLTRFSPRFLPSESRGVVGGYRYLMSKGAYFPFAQYDVLQCMTGPGHAMILSGSYPYQMGIPINVWFDQEREAPRYCVQDEQSPIVGGKAKSGVSPRNFTGSTVGDELKNAGYPSRVVTLALKDRSAILLGGRRGDLALWLDTSAVSWVSSQYYLPDGKLPAWVNELNRETSALKGKPYVWNSPSASTGLSQSSVSFSYSTPVGSRESFAMPLGIELTVQAAERALKAHKLGQGKSTDILALSFSSHDYMGHQFGPNSREMEEMTVAEDRQLSRLFNTVQKSLPGGLKDALIVLTADHGIPPDPKWLKSLGVDSGKINEKEAIQKMNERLDAKFGKPSEGSWFVYSSDLNFTFSRKALREKNVSEEQAEIEAKPALAGMNGVAYVFGLADYKARKLPPQMFGRQILKTYIPGKSGDLVAIPRAYYQVDEDAVSHMTSYAYDRSVPLIIAGSRMKAGVYSSPADVIDLAPTLSFVLGILPPATSEGRVLSEALAK